MKNYILKSLGVLAIIMVSVGISYIISKRDKVAYIELNKVFEKFEFKNELEKKLLKTNELRKEKLDSLEFELNVLSKQLQAEKTKDSEKIGLFQAKRDYYFQKKQEFEEDNSALVNQYDAQILKQLTQYVNDFGKENDYSYILGADGNGTIMYGKEKNNITDEVINYINSKYKGVK